MHMGLADDCFRSRRDRGDETSPTVSSTVSGLAKRLVGTSTAEPKVDSRAMQIKEVAAALDLDALVR